MAETQDEALYTPVILKNSETGQMKITWPNGKGAAVVMASDFFEDWVKGMNDMLALADLSNEMLDGYHEPSRKAPDGETWRKYNNLRRKLGLARGRRL
jgi:hypothetical protein